MTTHRNVTESDGMAEGETTWTARGNNRIEINEGAGRCGEIEVTNWGGTIGSDFCPAIRDRIIADHNAAANVAEVERQLAILNLELDRRNKELLMVSVARDNWMTEATRRLSVLDELREELEEARAAVYREANFAAEMKRQRDEAEREAGTWKTQLVIFKEGMAEAIRQLVSLSQLQRRG